MRFQYNKLSVWLPWVLVALPLDLSAAVQVTGLMPSPQSGAFVATSIFWQASSTDTNAGTLVYQFSERAANSADFTVVRDFHPSSAFRWTSSSRDGTFYVKVTVQNLSTHSQASVTASFVFTSRVTAGQPLVSATANPLVFLYSAPACPTGSYIRVKFQPTWATAWQVTPFRACNGIASMNFYLAGMLPATAYAAIHQIATGSKLTNGPTVPFTTGSIPPGVTFPADSIVTPPNAQTSREGVLLCDYITSGISVPFPTARDLAGDVIWYYNAVGNQLERGRFFLAPVAGGTFLLIAADQTIADPLEAQNQLIREFDLAGNTVRETNAQRVSAQLAVLGLPAITSFHHDAIRLPNQHTIVLGSEERIFPAGTQGSTSDVDILGDMVIDLDPNLQVVWAWNSYDHMDINRPAVLGETCTPLQAGCPPMFLAPVANDWLHSNCLYWNASDGSLLVSMRHQDWVVKIDYANGTGAGAVIWRLGSGGDFTIVSTDPYPWFSHQHDAGFENGGSPILSLYDNGNTRRTVDPAANSRGQVLQIDEVNLSASLLVNADLGVFSLAVGNAHQLENGDYHFTSGFIEGPSSSYSQAVETLASGALNYVQQSQVVSYRSYRMNSLYNPPPKYTYTQ